MFIYKDVWVVEPTSQELRTVKKANMATGRYFDSSHFVFLVWSAAIFCVSFATLLLTPNQYLYYMSAVLTTFSCVALIASLFRSTTHESESIAQKRLQNLARQLQLEPGRTHRFGQYDYRLQKPSTIGTPAARILAQAALRCMSYSHMKDTFNKAPYLVNNFLESPEVIADIARMQTEDDPVIRQTIKNSLNLAALETIGEIYRQTHPYHTSQPSL